MSERNLPNDVTGWLRELATGEMSDPIAYEEYVRTVSARLYEKYCILQDPAILAFAVN